MRALSLHQPWATLILLGVKTYETRDWATSWRGPLAIHAAKRWTRSSIDSTRDLCAEALAYDPPYELRRRLEALYGEPANCPLGCALGVVDLVAIHETNQWQPGKFQAEFGDFGPNRYAWKLANPRLLVAPLAFKGQQGIFDIPDALLRTAGPCPVSPVPCPPDAGAAA